MAEVYAGTVLSFNRQKGWGYINSPELKEMYDKDVFLHKDYMDRPLSQGDSVLFEIELRESDGMPQARNIKPANGVESGERHSGTVVSFNPAKGWGYIKCPPLFDMYGKDVFLHRDYIPGKLAVDVGNMLEFSVELRESDGMPQARDITNKSRARKAPQVPRPVQSKAPLVPRPVQSKAVHRMPITQNQRFSGKVVSFNPGKGWGYIHCPLLFAQFGKDVFLHKDYFNEGTTFVVGELVSFTFEINPKGMPQARDIKSQPTRPIKQVAAIGSMAKQKRARAQSGDERYNGVVLSFNDVKGWGYISCPEILELYGKDVFLHRDYLEQGCEITVGASVTFTVEARADGKPQARNITRTNKRQRR